MLIQHSECEYDGTSVKLPVHPASSGLQRRSREDSTQNTDTVALPC